MSLFPAVFLLRKLRSVLESAESTHHSSSTLETIGGHLYKVKIGPTSALCTQTGGHFMNQSMYFQVLPGGLDL